MKKNQKPQQALPLDKINALMEGAGYQPVETADKRKHPVASWESRDGHHITVSRQGQKIHPATFTNALINHGWAPENIEKLLKGEPVDMARAAQQQKQKDYLPPLDPALSKKTLTADEMLGHFNGNQWSLHKSPDKRGYVAPVPKFNGDLNVMPFNGDGTGIRMKDFHVAAVELMKLNQKNEDAKQAIWTLHEQLVNHFTPQQPQNAPANRLS
jgi:hypothetical protein